MPRADHLISRLDVARAAKWKLAVDEDLHGFKDSLEGLGFRVIKFDKGIEYEDLHPLLLQADVDFFVTKNCGGFRKHMEAAVPPRNQYHLIWIAEKLTADPTRAAKAVEGAILYDPRFKEGAAASFVKITGAYITELPKIKKESKQSRKK
jgi:hypothetical protein